MAAIRFLPLFFLFFLLPFSPPARAAAPSGQDWLTLSTPHFRVHHTPALEPYARSLALTLEWALPKIERRLRWQAPAPVDIVVMDNSDSSNGFAANFPNTHIEVLASPFGSDSVLAYYVDWVNELGSHELTHIVANDTTRGFYKTLRAIFGSWVKPNGLQPTWLMEGLATYEESSLTGGGRGRSPLTDALLREAVLSGKLDSEDYISLDRFNDGVPWWPGGNAAYLLGYTIQALPSRDNPDLPGILSHANAGNMIFSPNQALEDEANGLNWAAVWSSATKKLASRYAVNAGENLDCRLTGGGRFTGGHALASDGWIYFTEEDWDHGTHLARVRADAPCGKAEIERLWFKRYGGPGQVAVSESGRFVAFSAFDFDFEALYSHLWLWDREGKHAREIPGGLRGRDPAFVESEVLVFVRANPDTSQSLVRHELKTGKETVLLSTKPFEKISGLHGRGARLVYSFHDNHGHEKIFSLPSKGGEPHRLLPLREGEREFERNPFLAADGSVYFAATYGSRPQEIFRVQPGAAKAERILASSSGFLDRPQLSTGGSLIVQDYGLNGLNLARASLPAQPLPDTPPAQKDLHEFLTGEAPPAPFSGQGDLPASVPYAATGTPATSLWPQYWLPELSLANDGALIGASTSGNDPLEYHRYFLKGAWDTRANFPVYRVYYHNRSHTTNFHFEASQDNDYFRSSRKSNRNARYSGEAITPIGDTLLAYGSAFQERSLFGIRSSNLLFFGNFRYDRAGITPSAIEPNFGQAFNFFSALYPATKREKLFADLRPELHLFFPGFHPSHSIRFSGSLGITTNKLLASNYYLGGGPSALGNSYFVVRGYPSDTLFGQRISTANLAYTVPLAHPYHGGGTLPFFIQDLGMRLNADIGSANYLSVYSGKNFLFYEPQRLGERVITGFGTDFLMNGSVLYHVPYNVVAGIHYGPQKRYGGGFVYYFGLGLGITGLGAQPSHNALP